MDDQEIIKAANEFNDAQPKAEVIPIPKPQPKSIAVTPWPCRQALRHPSDGLRHDMEKGMVFGRNTPYRRVSPKPLSKKDKHRQAVREARAVS